ncbi:hypothetical protein FRC18_009940 [Serendipita sp. 400]|nr:hypothetical protein FRC18_009940 [Serendipita sp. 400]
MKSVSRRERLREAAFSATISALVCTGIHLASAPLWRKKLGRARYLSLSRRDQLYLGEKTVATLNGLVSGGLALYAVASGSYHGNVVTNYPRSGHWALGFFSGFSLYDTTIMALSVGEPIMMWIHHCLGFGGAFLMMYYREYSFFPVAFTITELTVIPWNIMWYLSKFNIPRSSSIMRHLLIFRAIAFLLIRAPIGVTTVAYAHKQTKDGIVALYRTMTKGIGTNRIAGRGTVINTTVFTILNLIWTLQAAKAVLSKKQVR